MARPREFDLDKSIENAMHVFWERGYDGASMSDLLDGMNISRGSLYKAFKSKRALFLKTLKHYERLFIDPAVAYLSGVDEPSGMKRIEVIIYSGVDAVRSGDRRGCLMCNSAAGVAAEDPEIAQLISEQLQRMQNAFATALAKDPGYKERPRAEILSKARGLTTSYVGLRILARSGQEIEALSESAKASVLK